MVVHAPVPNATNAATCLTRRSRVPTSASGRGAAARRAELPTDFQLGSTRRTVLHGEVLPTMWAERDVSALGKRAAAVATSPRGDDRASTGCREPRRRNRRRGWYWWRGRT